MDRRHFIKLTAVSGTSAALAGCGVPQNELIRFVPDEDIVPGVAVFKPSVCPLCQSGCGLTVRVMDADAEVVRNGQAGTVRIYAAKKLEGSAAHPVNQGGLCARGQAAIQVTYHPDRITQPLKRAGDRGSGRYEAISWDAALGELVTRLDALASGGNQKALAFLARPQRGHRAALVNQFLARFGATGSTPYELFSDAVLRRANALSFGRDQLPTFDLANARSVISFGADFLGTWNSPVSQSRAYGAMRQGRPGLRGRFVQVESRMSQTGANADEWVPVRPGTEGVLALGLANVVAAAKGQSGDLSVYTPEQVEKTTGVTAARIERIARGLIEQSPAVAIVGGSPLAHTNGLFTALAVNRLNAVLGSVGQPGGMLFTPQAAVAGASASAAPGNSFRLQPEGGDSPFIGDAQLLLIDGVNPVFTAPRSWKVAEALQKIPYIVSFGSFLDETSILSDLILPDHSFLESWAESVPESGSSVAVINAAPPVMKPLHDTRAMEDVLLDVSRRLSPPLDLPWQTFEDMLTATFAKLPGPSAETDAWTDAQEKGGWWGTLPAALTAPAAKLVSVSAVPELFSEPQFAGDAQQYPLHFLPFASSAFLDGSLAHLPWMQEMPDPLTSAMWSSWLEINPETAARLGIAQGDVVEVASEQGTIRSSAMITPGIAPDLVAMPVGQGHTTFTRYASGRGENPIDLLAPMTESTTGAWAWAATRVKISRVGGPDGRLVLFAGGMREHEDHGR